MHHCGLMTPTRLFHCLPGLLVMRKKPGNQQKCLPVTGELPPLFAAALPLPKLPAEPESLASDAIPVPLFHALDS